MSAQLSEQNRRTEVVSKDRFEAIKSKFNHIADEAQKRIDSAKSSDLLALDLTFTNPIDIVSAKVMTPDEFMKEAFSEDTD